MKVSLDGESWLEADEVRIVYEGVDVPGEDDPGEVHIVHTHEGMVTDVWVTREDPLDHNIATHSVLLCDWMDDLIEESA
jgi:hypothetical protein